jgi:hypothetical protein
MDIYKICKRFKNVKVLDISNISREYHTRHGLHFNRIGKKFITQEIGKIIGNNSKNYTNVIALGFSNQGNVCTRLDPQGSSQLKIKKLK